MSTVMYIILLFWPNSLICEALGVVPLVMKVCLTAACCHDLLGVSQVGNWRSFLADFCASTCDERDIIMRHSWTGRCSGAFASMLSRRSSIASGSVFCFVLLLCVMTWGSQPANLWSSVLFEATYRAGCCMPENDCGYLVLKVSISWGRSSCVEGDDSRWGNMTTSRSFVLVWRRIPVVLVRWFSYPPVARISGKDRVSLSKMTTLRSIGCLGVRYSIMTAVPTTGTRDSAHTPRTW